MASIEDLFVQDLRSSSVGKETPAIQETLVQFLGQENPLEKGYATHSSRLGPGDSGGKESACNVGDLGLIPGFGKSPEGGHGNPLQYSCLKKPHGQRSLEAIAHGVAKSQT